MGMFKDIRDLKKLGKEQIKQQGGRRQMMKDTIASAKGAMSAAAEQQRLATEGVAGEATIKSMQATGTTVNRQPEIVFELTVTVHGRPTNVSHRQVISPAMLGQLQPGATVACLVDPADHAKLVLGMTR